MSRRITVRTASVALGVVVLVAVAIGAVVLSTSGSRTDAPAVGSSGPYGTAVYRPVPGNLRGLSLTNQYGQRVSLASWSGKTVMLVPFLSLCSDICPMTTGNLLQVEQSLRADGASSHVQIVELTVDPGRDIPARLAAYAKLTGAGWQLLTETPAELEALAKFFGFTYEKVAEETPPSIDWWTGKPLTYDVDHSDNYFVLDARGNERIVQAAAPNFHGHLNPKLYRFLSEEGREHLTRPERPNWTPADALQALSIVLGRNLAVSPLS